MIALLLLTVALTFPLPAAAAPDPATKHGEFTAASAAEVAQGVDVLDDDGDDRDDHAAAGARARRPGARARCCDPAACGQPLHDAGIRR